MPSRLAVAHQEHGKDRRAAQHGEARRAGCGGGGNAEEIDEHAVAPGLILVGWNGDDPVRMQGAQGRLAADFFAKTPCRRALAER